MELKEKIRSIVEWILEKKGENTVHFDVTGKTDFTDAIIVCNGTVDIHNRAISTHIVQKAKEHKFDILSKEGLDKGEWILLDFGEIIVHIFNEQKRNLYKIEDLYKFETKREL
ncbi:MAG: ribosome silencing factor [Candidatus Cloacimonetes bacterium]|jgi:ribosome-associated protein|nr:ribosome silencing factor [Candidatus Cloacimonadota bacterium]MBT6994945.1 ribosome silencing factor [Candidatus Cloacimonadota bacterium]MBT7469524.1 ribosome silencing factor [Candidatus Cloacimonadota bacterium]